MAQYEKDANGLPRMRGDRPLITGAQIRRMLATPHARGSTRFRPARVKRRRGYPACAGIDLSSSVCIPMASWLPRMRGDRPVLR